MSHELEFICPDGHVTLRKLHVAGDVVERGPLYDACDVCGAAITWRPRYVGCAYVWLKAFEDQPRRLCRLHEHGQEVIVGMYAGEVRVITGDASGDDLEREFSEDHIEGPALVVESDCRNHQWVGFGPVVHTLEEASVRARQLALAWDIQVNAVSGRRAELVGIAGEQFENEESRLAVRHYEGCELVIWLDGRELYCSGDDDTCGTWEPL